VGERCATLEIKINYLAPVSEGRITAEAWMVARTARIAVLEARVQAHRTAWSRWPPDRSTSRLPARWPILAE
jgi:acyl-coenzyme A thioesterase PaaI-like protein